MIERLQRNVERRVASDTDIRPEQVVVDRRGDTDHMNPKLAQHIRSRLGPVAADHHHPVDAPLSQVAKRLGPATLLPELRGTGTAKKRPADLNDTADIARTQLPELTVDQTLPTLPHAVTRHVLIQRTTRDGAYGRIHARGVTTARQ